MSKTADAQLALQRLVKSSGSQLKAARALGLSPQYVNDLLKGRRQFSDAVLDKLGLKWETVTR